MSGTHWDGGRRKLPGIIPNLGHGAVRDHLGMAPGAAPSIFLRIPGSLVWDLPGTPKSWKWEWAGNSRRGNWE